MTDLMTPSPKQDTLPPSMYRFFPRMQAGQNQRLVHDIVSGELTAIHDKNN